MDTRLAEIYEKLQRLDDSDSALNAISELEAEATAAWLPHLHEWLARPGDFFLRESVAPAVIRLEGMAALPQLIAALRMGFAEGHDCDGLQAAVFELVESEPAAAVRILLPMGDSASDADRRDAAWLLGLVASEVPSDTLLRLARDSAPRVRGAACGSLGSPAGSEKAYAVLIEGLDDPDAEVRIAAASALGGFGDSRAVPSLDRLLSRCAAQERGVVEYAIRRLRSK